jgi:ankyrin repeat protein
MIEYAIRCLRRTIILSSLLIAASVTATKPTVEESIANAISKGDLAQIKMLVKNRNPDQWVIGIKTKTHPLIAACQQNKLEIAQYLLGAGANPNLHDATGGYPLYFAINNQNLVLTELLLKYGAKTEANPKIATERPALFWAIESDSPKMVALLLKHGADPTATVEGQTLIAYASEEASPVIAKLLKKHTVQKK